MKVKIINPARAIYGKTATVLDTLVEAYGMPLTVLHIELEDGFKSSVFDDEVEEV